MDKKTKLYIGIGLLGVGAYLYYQSTQNKTTANATGPKPLGTGSGPKPLGTGSGPKPSSTGSVPTSSDMGYGSGSDYGLGSGYNGSAYPTEPYECPKGLVRCPRGKVCYDPNVEYLVNPCEDIHTYQGGGYNYQAGGYNSGYNSYGGGMYGPSGSSGSTTIATTSGYNYQAGGYNSGYNSYGGGMYGPSGSSGSTTIATTSGYELSAGDSGYTTGTGSSYGKTNATGPLKKKKKKGGNEGVYGGQVGVYGNEGVYGGQVGVYGNPTGDGGMMAKGGTTKKRSLMSNGRRF
jgi:hypothetical protein